MALRTKYLQFAKSGSTGTQTISIVGFKGKALLLWSTGQTASGATTAATISQGMTDSTLQSVRAIHHPGGESATTSAQSERTDRIAWKTNATSGATPTILVEGEFTGFTANGFTINWHTNDGNADIYHALVLGGDLEAKFVHQKITVGAPGTLDVTGVDFQPTAFIVMGGAADEFGTGDYNVGAPFGSMHGFGFSNASDNVCGWTLGRGTAGAADNYRGQHTDRVSSVRIANLSGASEQMGMRITATGSDGFTITRDVGTTGSQPVQHVLCLRGIQFALGSFNAPTATGTSTLTLPFRPDMLMLQSLGASASSNAAGLGLGFGAWQRTDDAAGGVWIGGVDAANPSEYRRATYVDSVLETRNPSGGALQLQAAVTASAADGVTLDWTSVSGNADAVIYMAMAAVTKRAFIWGSERIKVTADSVVAFAVDQTEHIDADPNTIYLHGNVAQDSGDTVLDGDVHITGNLIVDGTSPGGSPALDDLSDVTITSPATNDVLKYNGSAWVNGSVSGATGALILLEHHDASGSASLDFAGCISSLYDDYQIELINLIPSTETVTLNMRMSTDGGTSYDSSGVYSHSQFVFRAAASANAGAESGASSIVLNFSTVGIRTTASDGGLCGSIRLFNPLSTTAWKRIMGDVVFIDQEPFRLMNMVQGMYESVTAVNAFRFFMSSGNIASGSVRVYGIAKT